MRKHVLNLYEQELPPKDINNLWVDIDENTGEIRAVHRYNKSKGSWSPYLVAVSYLKPEGEKEDNDIPKFPGVE